MKRAFAVELLKLRRSTVVRVATLLLGLAVPAMGLAFHLVAVGDSLVGPLAGKAAALSIGEGWTAYLRMVDQIAAVAVFLGAGIVTAWSFGREHTDGTFPSLFSIAVPRSSVAVAKFGALIVWITVASSLLVVAALGLGLAGRVGPTFAVGEAVRLGAVTAGAALLSLTVAIAASAGRGPLPAIGAIVMLVAISQVAVLFGTGGWLPFAVPGLAAVAGADGYDSINAIQLALVPITALTGAAVTVAWWRSAEVV